MARANRRLKIVPLGMAKPKPRPPVWVGAISIPADVVGCALRTLERLQDLLLGIEGEMRALLAEGTESETGKADFEERLICALHDRSHLHQLAVALKLALVQNEGAHERFFEEERDWTAAERAAGRLPALAEPEEEEEDPLPEGLLDLMQQAFGERFKPVVN